MGAMEFKTEKEIFDAIAQKVSKVTGVQLGERQESLVYSRLSKHLRNKGGLSAQQYWEYLAKNEAEEFPVLISLLTTHHTYFFREKVHFDLLLKELPALIAQLKNQNRKTIRIWCAASSRGQEGYSLAMFMDFHLKQLAPQFDFHILFSDVDQESVKFSREGVYPNEELAKIPLNYRSNHWQRSTELNNETSRIKPHLLSRCDFRVINLLHLHRLVLKEKFDIIFCRNVFIYFTPKEVERTTIQLLSHLEEHGYFIIGVSESLLNLKVPLKIMANSVYRRRPEGSPPPLSHLPARTSKVSPGHKAPGSPDSSSQSRESTSDRCSVLILQRRLTIGFHFRKLLQDLGEYRSVGFEVIAQAEEGLALIRDRKPQLLIIDGSALAFLKEIREQFHLPVLVIKSDSEHDPELQQWEKDTAIKIIQKPFREAALGQLEVLKRSLSELRTMGKGAPIRPSLPSTEKHFDTSLLLALGASTGGTEALTKIISQLPSGMPPIVIVQHIPEGFSRNFASRLDQCSALSVREAKDGEMIGIGDVVIAPGNFHMEILGRPGHYRTRVFEGEKVNGHRPSVDVLFRSVARSAGSKAVGVILTGMGSDGAEGLLTINQKGGKTFGQDAASCIVYGMPKVAQQLGAVERVVSLPLIATELIKASLLKPEES